MSDETSETGNRYMFQLVKQMLFFQKYLKKNKDLSWHLMPLQVRFQENFRGCSI